MHAIQGNMSLVRYDQHGLYIILPVGNRVICAIQLIFPGVDLCCTDRAHYGCQERGVNRFGTHL